MGSWAKNGALFGSEMARYEVNEDQIELSDVLGGRTYKPWLGVPVI